MHIWSLKSKYCLFDAHSVFLDLPGKVLSQLQNRVWEVPFLFLLEFSGWWLTAVCKHQTTSASCVAVPTSAAQRSDLADDGAQVMADWCT